MTSDYPNNPPGTPLGRVANRDLFLGVAAIVVLLVVSAALAYWNTRQLDIDAGWVSNTNRVRALTADVLLSIVDAETGMRGFVITGKEDFLQPYEAAVVRSKGQLEALKYETRDNAEQQARLRLLEERSAVVLDRFERIIAIRRKSEKEAHAVVATGEGKVLIDAIRALVREMDDEEVALLGERAARSARSYRTAVSTGLLTDVLVLAMVGVFVVVLRRNLRRRATAAAALHMERERLRVTLASIGDGVIATDPSGNVTFLNEIACDLTGWTPDAAHGKPLAEVFAIVNEETRNPVENPALRALAEGVIVGLANHTLLIARDGTERPIDDSAAPIRDRAGEVHGAVLVFRDITDRKASEDALRESERRKSAVLRASLDAILTIDADGRVVAFNPAAEGLFGYSQAEAIGADMGELIVPESMRQGHRQGMVHFLATGEAPVLNQRLEMPARRKDGSEITVELVITRIDGDQLLFTGFLRDITARKRAEADLADRVRLLALSAEVGSALTRNEPLPEILQRCAAALVEHLDGAFARVWILDPREDVLILLASAGLYTHLDGPHGRVPVGKLKIGRIAEERKPHLTNAVPGDERVPEQEWARAEGMVAFAGYPLLIGDRLLGVMAMFARHPLAPHTLDAMAAVADEIALGIDRKHAEERLAQLLAAESNRSRRLRQVAQASLTLNAATTPGSVFGVVQVEAQRIIGANRSAIQATTDETPSPLGALTAALIGRSGRPIGQIHLTDKPAGAFTEDDEAILVQLAHMASIALENARLYEELREGDRRKDEFLATLAHELRNPLAPIRNSLQIMRLAGADRSTMDDSRAMIERQVQQMVRLVDDLLDISRISRGKMELRRERVELATAIAGAVETSRPLIERMGHTLTVTLPTQPVHLHADLTRLAQVFLNLLNNAAKYSQPGGRIALTAELASGGCEPPDTVIVRVSDTGIGIPADMLPRIFEIFTQVDRSLERSQGGLGIGLTLVKRLTELHGGDIVARSDGPGAGSEFTVRLPILPESADEPEGAAPAAETPALPARRILVVDDNRDSADSLTMILEILGNEVHTAYDGVEAVEAATAFRPDLVFLDIGLPRLNGYDAARRIRQLPGGKNVVLVALTGWGQEDDRRRSREAGFDHHLVKPVDPEELARLLAEAGA